MNAHFPYEWLRCFFLFGVFKNNFGLIPCRFVALYCHAAMGSNVYLSTLHFFL